ncbi:anti-sigma factor [Nocardia sp. NPDC049190]|uniref:anti-sigma factor n=1 Tax=Nocardia sp. NPDC049190 TaxID=3155650 RepID=UPI0033EB4F6F
MRVITDAFGARTAAGTTVSVRIPAAARHLAMVRGMADTVCLVADFPLDAAADIRLAISEIASMLIVDAVPGSLLGCAFTYSANRMDVRVDAVSEREVEVSGDPLTWELVRMLTSSIAVFRDPGATDAREYRTAIEFRWERGRADDT